MTDAQWETLSNQAVAAAGVVYFLALLAHAVQWAALRDVPVQQAVAAGGGPVVAVPDERQARTRTAMAGPARRPADRRRRRSSTSSRSSGAGMAADPNRVPWGNMYEFTLSRHLRGRRCSSWPPPAAAGCRGSGRSWSASCSCVLMVAVLWLYEPVAPLTEAL